MIFETRFTHDPVRKESLLTAILSENISKAGLQLAERKVLGKDLYENTPHKRALGISKKLTRLSFVDKVLFLSEREVQVVIPDEKISSSKATENSVRSTLAGFLIASLLEHIGGDQIWYDGANERVRRTWRMYKIKANTLLLERRTTLEALVEQRNERSLDEAIDICLPKPCVNIKKVRNNATQKIEAHKTPSEQLFKMLFIRYQHERRT